MTNRYLSQLCRNFAALADQRFCTLIGSSGETTISWRQLEADCLGWVATYRAAGLASGDLVLIFLRHVPQLYGSYFGAMLAGLTPSFMPCSSPRQDPALYWASHNELMQKIQPAAVLADAATLGEMDAAGLDLGRTKIIRMEDATWPGSSSIASSTTRQIAGEEAIGLLQHSSGTTGLKKGVALSYRAIAEQVESYAKVIGVDGSNTVVSWLPLYHDMGLIACCVAPAYLGTPIVHIDAFHWLVKPGLLLERLASEPEPITWLPNFAFDHLSAICARDAEKYDLSGVRAFINCSEPCKPATFDRFASAFAASGVRSDHLQCCYAMAESVFAVSQTQIGETPYRVRVDSWSLDRGRRPSAAEGADGVELVECGRAIPGIEIHILDEAGGEAAEGTVGEIALKGDFMFSGYNRDSERSAARIVGGLYRTNDVGFLDEAGRLFVLGRLDDLIIINGRNLYAHEVEAVVNKVPGVKPGRAVAMSEFNERVGSETLLIAAEQRKGDDRPRADVQREIQTAVHSVFSVVPHRIEVVDEGSLVKTTSGKISRKENLARFGAPRRE